MSGDFGITEGNYLFTYQNLVNKNFIVKPGGTISWSGDPYAAQLDIQAAYQLLLSRRESWGFICRPVNKKNGTKAFKILNHDDDVREITADSVYFAM